MFLLSYDSGHTPLLTSIGGYIPFTQRVERLREKSEELLPLCQLKEVGVWWRYWWLLLKIIFKLFTNTKLFSEIKNPLNCWDIFLHLMTITYSPLREDVAYWDYLWALPERRYPGWWDDMAGFSARKKSIITCERCLNKDIQVCEITGHIFRKKKPPEVGSAASDFTAWIGSIDLTGWSWALPDRRYIKVLYFSLENY